MLTNTAATKTEGFVEQWGGGNFSLKSVLFFVCFFCLFVFQEMHPIDQIPGVHYMSCVCRVKTRTTIKLPSLL